jgi:putative addiction module CopG family antidote
VNVNLSDDLAEFVAEQTRDGGYTNESEVVREGLRLLRARKNLRWFCSASDCGMSWY